MLSARRHKPQVTLRFLAAQHSFATPMEVMRVARHRYVLGYYVVGICASAFLRAITTTDGTAALELPIAGISLFVFMAVSFLYLRIWVLLSGKADHVTVWMSPGLLLAACATYLVSGFLLDVMHVQSKFPIAQWAAVLVIFVAAEGVAALVMRALVPRAQQQLRAGRDAFAILSQGEDRPVLTFGKTRIAQADILRIEANGNHVQIVTAQKRHIVPGPFASVLDQMPKMAGCRVHRSHWVATQSVLRVEIGEQGLRLRMVQGDIVPVSQRPSADLMLWLDMVSGKDAARATRSSARAREPGVPTMLI